jgi:hypothetical protein
MLPEDHLIIRGLKAESILRSDEFNELFDLIVSEIGREILETDLDDKEKHREHLYLTVHGMRAFSARLASYVVTKKQIEDDRNNKIEQDDD